MTYRINKKLGELPIHISFYNIGLNDLLWDFDAVSLYPSAMSDEKSIYPREESGYASTKDMNDEIVKKFKEGNLLEEVQFQKSCIISQKI